MKSKNILGACGEVLPMSDLVKIAEGLSAEIDTMYDFPAAQRMTIELVRDICELFEQAYHLEKCYTGSK